MYAYGKRHKAAASRERAFCFIWQTGFQNKEMIRIQIWWTVIYVILVLSFRDRGESSLSGRFVSCETVTRVLRVRARTENDGKGTTTAPLAARLKDPGPGDMTRITIGPPACNGGAERQRPCLARLLCSSAQRLLFCSFYDWGHEGRTCVDCFWSTTHLLHQWQRSGGVMAVLCKWSSRPGLQLQTQVSADHASAI